MLAVRHCAVDMLHDAVVCGNQLIVMIVVEAVVVVVVLVLVVVVVIA